VDPLFVDLELRLVRGGGALGDERGRSAGDWMRWPRPRIRDDHQEPVGWARYVLHGPDLGRAGRSCCTYLFGPGVMDGCAAMVDMALLICRWCACCFLLRWRF
jgi:hypothetical protein